MAFAMLEGAAAAARLAAGIVGLEPPPLHHAPCRARSVGEFWSRRWNLVVSRILRTRCFEPLAHRSRVLALFASFGASAAIHAYIGGAALGVVAVLPWIAFFLAQPFAILAERRLSVRRWSEGAARAWTFGVFVVLGPLFLEPFLRLFVRLAAVR